MALLLIVVGYQNFVTFGSSGRAARNQDAETPAYAGQIGEAWGGCGRHGGVAGKPFLLPS